MKAREFKEAIFEQAFGDNAINRDFSMEEVLEEIKRQCSELENFKKYQKAQEKSMDDETTEEQYEYLERVIKEIKLFQKGD